MPGSQWDTLLSGSLLSPLLGPQQGAGIHGQCKTGPSAPLPLSHSCQHPAITCSIGTLWKWPTAAWPSWHAWLTFSICHRGFCVFWARVYEWLRRVWIFCFSVSLLTYTSTICYWKKRLIKMVKWGESKIHPVHISLSYNINTANCLSRRAKRQFFSH